MAQLYPLLLERDARTGDILPSLAATAEFTGDTEYTVTLPEGLEFANGDELTASDVVFSFQRMLEIGLESGPASLLAGVVSVEEADPLTVVFHLAQPDDASFPSALASPAGVIVDEEVFSADAVTPLDVITAGEPFAGAYQLGEVSSETRMTLVANPAYFGEPAQTAEIELELGVDAQTAAARLAAGEVDVVWGVLPAQTREELSATADVRAVSRPSATLRSLAFDLATMPFGMATDEPDEAKAAAVRLAIADLVDREALAEAIPGEWIGWAGYLPETLGGSADPITTRTGDGEGGPDVEAAAAALESAGVTAPVAITIAVGVAEGADGPDGLSAELAAQLQESGLFEVTVSPEVGPFTKAVLAENHFPIFEHTWTPLGNDPDDYLLALYGADSALSNNARDDDLDEALAAEGSTTDPSARRDLVVRIQDRLASRLTSIPLVQRVDVAFVGTRVTGGAISGRGHLDFASLLVT